MILIIHLYMRHVFYIFDKFGFVTLPDLSHPVYVQCSSDDLFTHTEKWSAQLNFYLAQACLYRYIGLHFVHVHVLTIIFLPSHQAAH